MTIESKFQETQYYICSLQHTKEQVGFILPFLGITLWQQA